MGGQVLRMSGHNVNGHHHGHHGHHDHHHAHHAGYNSNGLELSEDEKQGVMLVNAAVHLALLGLVIAALVWAYCERNRRRRVAAEAGGFPERSGSYQSGLFECIGFPHICFPAFFFTPFLAAFNRAAADKRDCSVCDVCCTGKAVPFVQYLTRQSIRADNLLEEEEFGDCLAACCCTPCAVGQDALELERRAAPSPIPAVQIVTTSPDAVVIVPGAVADKGEYSKVEMKQV